MTGIRHHDGFTLVELLVVLALMGFAAVMTAGFVRPRPGTVSLHNTTLQVAGQLRLVRTFAVLNSREAAAVFDLERRRLTGDGMRAPLQLPACTQATLTTAKLEARTTALAVIRFHPDGGSSGGRITLTCYAEQETLVVDWLTGSVGLEMRR